jgi:hypothetical protein
LEQLNFRRTVLQRFDIDSRRDEEDSVCTTVIEFALGFFTPEQSSGRTAVEFSSSAMICCEIAVFASSTTGNQRRLSSSPEGVPPASRKVKTTGRIMKNSNPRTCKTNDGVFPGDGKDFFHRYTLALSGAAGVDEAHVSRRPVDSVQGEITFA